MDELIKENWRREKDAFNYFVSAYALNSKDETYEPCPVLLKLMEINAILEFRPTLHNTSFLPKV